MCNKFEKGKNYTCDCDEYSRGESVRVLQINTVCGRGSTGRIATDLLRCLKEEGSTGKIAYGVDPALNIDEKEKIKIGTKFDYYCHNILSRITDKEGLYSKKASHQLIQQIEEYNPDIIHLHNIHGHYINYKELFLYLKEKHIPVIWTFHDCWSFTGHCTYFSAAKCEQWKSECIKCSQLNKYPMCYTKGQVEVNYNEKKDSFLGVNNLTIVTPSEWMAQLVKQSFLKDYPVKVINNGIDLKKFQNKKRGSFRKKYHLEGEQIILSVASEWSERKGYSDFIKMSQLLSNNQKLVMVGVNDKQIKELPESIITIKKTNSVEELAEIYSDADVFFNFTYEDNFPTVNLEAMACGTPIVTYRTGGSIEAIDQKNGFVVEQGDYSGALKLVDRAKLLDRKNIVTCAHAYEAEKKYKQYIELYRNVLNKGDN